MTAKYQNYSFTWNNYTNDTIALLADLDCEYIVYGKEVGASGTPHLQGYVRFKNERSEKAVRKVFLGANIDPTISNSGSIEYCQKGEQPHEEWEQQKTAGPNYGLNADVYERGKKPAGQGKRSDLDAVRDLLKENPKMRKVVDIASSYQSVKMAEQILKYKEAPRNWECEVYWFWGSTGSGKSRTAFEICDPDDTYVCMSTAKWFDGYDGHSDVIIDDMRKDFCKFHELLRLLDRYAYKVETKGGTRQFRAKRIFITSCFSPQVLFSTREDINQLLRRIKEIRLFGTDTTPPEYTDTDSTF